MNPKPASLLLLSALLSLPSAAQPPSRRAEVISVTERIPDDPTVQKVIAPLAAEIKASFDLPLVQAPQGLFRSRIGEENLLGYWVTDVMRKAVQEALGVPVRFALTNAGGLRSNLRPGQLKVADIFELIPFENELLVIELTGAEVVQVVKEGIVGRGGEPCSGVKTVVGGTPGSATVALAWEDGSAIDPEALVKVVTIDFLYSGGGTTPTLRKGRRPVTTGLTLRQILLDECAALAKQNKELLAPPTGRYAIPIAIQDAIRAKAFRF